MRTIGLNTILTSWDTGPSAILLYLSVVGMRLLYVVAAATGAVGPLDRRPLSGSA